jgi:phosphorylcholine metabolism protein LicD
VRNKIPRGAIKKFRELLNNESAGQPLHKHNQYHQLKRPYGDYLYAQDHEKFMVDLMDWLEEIKP